MATASALAARARKQFRDPSVVLLLTTGASAVLRLGSNLVLAHLLVPRDFGLLAIVTMVATALAMLSDTGVWVSIVRKGSSVDRKWLDQLWTLQVGRGFVLWLIAAATAYPVATAYHEPLLLWLLPAGNLWLIIQGFESLQPFVRTRDLRPGLALTLQLVSQIVGATVSIAVALVWPSPWALVAGLLAGAFGLTIMSHVWSGESLPKPHLTRGFLRDQWRLACWLGVSTGLGFFGGQIDRLLFPAWFGTTAFGVYSIALTLAFFPLMLGMRWADNVYMPAIAKLSQDQSDESAAKFRSLIRTIGIYAALGSAMIAVIGQPFFLALYPRQFAPAATFIEILSVTTYATFLTYLHRRTFLYQGLTRLEASIEASRLVLFLAAFGLAIQLGYTLSASRYVALYALVQVAVYGGLLVVGRAKRLVHVRDDLPGHAVFIATLIGMGFLGQAIEQRFGAFAALVTSGLIGAALCLGAAVRLGLPKLPAERPPTEDPREEFAGVVDPFDPAQEV